MYFYDCSGANNSYGFDGGQGGCSSLYQFLCQLVGK